MQCLAVVEQWARAVRFQGQAIVSFAIRTTRINLEVHHVQAIGEVVAINSAAQQSRQSDEQLS